MLRCRSISFSSRSILALAADQNNWKSSPFRLRDECHESELLTSIEGNCLTGFFSSKNGCHPRRRIDAENAVGVENALVPDHGDSVAIDATK